MKSTAGQGGHAPITTTQAERQLAAARTVLADREAELLELKGPCRTAGCRLHYAHRGPCDIRRQEG